VSEYADPTDNSVPPPGLGDDQDQGEPDDLEETEDASPEEVYRALRTGIEIHVASSTEVARRIVERIMAAESREELWDPIVPVGARDLSMTPIRVFGFQALKSSMNNAVGVFLMIDAVDLSSGEKLLVSCGAPNVVGKLVRAAQLDALPENVRFTLKPSRLNPDQQIIDLELVAAEQVP